MPDQPKAPPAPKLDVMQNPTTNPLLNEVMWRMQRDTPADFRDLTVSSMPMSDPNALTMVMGTTPFKPNQAAQSIQINPGTIAFDPTLTQSTMAHELQHVRQNRTPQTLGHVLMTKYLMSTAPYLDQPNEKNAVDTETAYDQSHGLPSSWQADPTVLNALPNPKGQ